MINPSNDTGNELRKGALLRHGEELVTFVGPAADDGERWRVRDLDQIVRVQTVYPEDVTGYSNRIYV